MVKKQTYIPVSNIVPLVFREGASLLELIHGLAKYVQDTLHPSLKHVVDNVVAEVESQMDQAKADYVAGVEEFQRIHDAFMVDVESSLKALNDGAVSDLVGDSDSLLGATIRSLLESEVTGGNTTVQGYFDNRYPSYSGALNFWVHPDGSDDDGDGTETRPYRTLTHACKQVEHHTLRNDAKVNVRLFPQDYHEVVRLPTELSQNVHYHIHGYDVGGHPSVPLTRFKDVDGLVFWSHNPNVHLTLENIKFKDCDAGGVGYSNNIVHLVNVHAEDVGTAATVTNGVLDVKGGIYTRCTEGLFSFMNTRHAIGRQHAGNTDQGPWFYDCGLGVRIQELATGHVDYTLFDGNDTAIRLSRSGHVNPDGSEFRNNGTDIEASSTSTVTAGTRIVFGEGSERSDRPLSIVNGSVYTGGGLWSSISSGETLEQKMIRHQNNEVSHDGGGTLVQFDLNPIMWDDPRNQSYPRKGVILKIFGEITGDSSTGKRLLLSLGGGSNAALASLPSYTGPFNLEVEVSFNGHGEQTAKLIMSMHNQNTLVRTMQWSADMSVEQRLQLDGQLTSDGDGGFTVYDQQVWFRGV